MQEVGAAQRIIIALDTNAARARELAQELQGKVLWLKVGMTLYYSAGPAIVEEFKSKGFKVFVDLKLHDIPHQVQGAAKAVVLAGADMLTVHASGGLEMMQAACRGAEEARRELALGTQEKPICLAITVLTSMDGDALSSIGVNDAPAKQVSTLAALAKAAGMDGVVCSPQEAAVVRAEQGGDFVLVTPGVRPTGSDRGDQSRIATPASALASGADYLVIGRPITGSENPAKAFESIETEMSA